MYRAMKQDADGAWREVAGSRSYDREWAKVWAKDTATATGHPTTLERASNKPGRWIVEHTYIQEVT